MTGSLKIVVVRNHDHCCHGSDEFHQDGPGLPGGCDAKYEGICGETDRDLDDAWGSCSPSVELFKSNLFLENRRGHCTIDRMSC